MCRILTPLLAYLGSSALGKYLQIYTENSQCAVQAAVHEDEICWKQNLRESRGEHIHSEIFNLSRMILQGPVLQFMRKSDICSVKKLPSI